MEERDPIRRGINKFVIQPIARYRERLTEPSGKGEMRAYLFMVAGIFAAMGAAGVVANVIFPALNSLDGAAASGAITTVAGAVSAKI